MKQNLSKESSYPPNIYILSPKTAALCPSRPDGRFPSHIILLHRSVPKFFPFMIIDSIRKKQSHNIIKSSHPLLPSCSSLSSNGILNQKILPHYSTQVLYLSFFFFSYHNYSRFIIDFFAIFQ